MKIYRSSIRERAKEKKMILPEINNKGRSSAHVFRFIAAAVVATVFILVGVTADAALKQKV